MKTALYIAGGLVALLFAFGFASSSTPEGKERARQRAVISMCWDNQGRKSLSQGAGQFVSGVCEQKEREFSSRWGVNP